MEYILNLKLQYIVLIVFISLILSAELGYYIGRNIKKIFTTRLIEAIDDNQSTITNSALGLLALFLGFTFSSALEHFETNRNTITNEAISINSLYNNLKVIPDKMEIPFLQKIHEYTSSRIYNEDAVSDEYLKDKQKTSEKIQDELFDMVERITDDSIKAQLSDKVNELSKSQLDRTASLLNGVPSGLFLPVALFLIFNGVMMGLSLSDGKSRHLIISWGLYFIIGLAVGIIVDLDRPLKGFIDVDQSSIINIEKKIENRIDNLTKPNRLQSIN